MLLGVDAESRHPFHKTLRSVNWKQLHSRCQIDCVWLPVGQHNVANIFSQWEELFGGDLTWATWKTLYRLWAQVGQCTDSLLSWGVCQLHGKIMWNLLFTGQLRYSLSRKWRKYIRALSFVFGQHWVFINQSWVFYLVLQWQKM